MNSTTLVFDLDDTLVKEIDFLKSAFKEIALFLEPSDKKLFEEMFHLYLQKKNVFEFLSQKYKVDVALLKSKYRNHFPEFANRNDVKNLLETFKNLGCKLGLITDGYSITQRNKLKALQIEM